MDASSGRADDGKLFSLEAVALAEGVGLAIRVAGMQLLPQILRLGGDGHAARLSPLPITWPEPDYEALAKAGRARMILSTPGLFERGWLPTGAGKADAARGSVFELRGVSGKIVCAATPRSHVVSGFDLARWQPKPAKRAAASGSVYWIDDLRASASALRKLADEGLWEDSGYSNPRRPEGYNRFTWAAW